MAILLHYGWRRPPCRCRSLVGDVIRVRDDGLGLRSRRRSSWALKATTTVDTDIRMAPSDMGMTNPIGAGTRRLPPEVSSWSSTPGLAPQEGRKATVMATPMSSIIPGCHWGTSSTAPVRNGRRPTRT